jgi:hypothetical protein
MKRRFSLFGIQTLSFSYTNTTVFSSDWPKFKQSLCKTEFRFAHVKSILQYRYLSKDDTQPVAKSHLILQETS